MRYFGFCCSPWKIIDPLMRGRRIRTPHPLRIHIFVSFMRAPHGSCIPKWRGFRRHKLVDLGGECQFIRWLAAWFVQVCIMPFISRLLVGIITLTKLYGAIKNWSFCTHHPPQIYRNVQLSYTFLTISTVHSFCCCRQVDLQKQICQEVLLLIIIFL